MRRYAMLVLAAGALVAVSAVGIAGAAGGEGPVTVKIGELELTSQIGLPAEGRLEDEADADRDHVLR